MPHDRAQFPTIADLGWSAFFADQVLAADHHLGPVRISEVHRARISAISPTGVARLIMPHGANTGAYAVGDWVLIEPETGVLHRHLERWRKLQDENVSNTPVQTGPRGNKTTQRKHR